MPKEDYIPHQDDALNLWLQNFKKKIGSYGPGLGMTAGEVTDSQNECDGLSSSITGVTLARNSFQNTVKAKDELRTTTVADLRRLAGRLKTNAGYTESIGKDLGISGSDSGFDPATAKPTLATSLNGGQVTLQFDRRQSNGIRIYSKRGAETAFTFLALDTHTPYHDTRENATPGQPETRQYYAFYVDKHDSQFGLQSDTVSVTV